MMFDLRTLLVVEVLMYLVLGLLQVGVWRQRGTERAFLYWGCGNLCASLGCVLSALRGVIPDVASISLGNGAVILGLALMWAGQRRFAAQPVHVWILWLGPLVITLLYAFHPLMAQSIMARTALLYGTIFLYSVLCAVDLWRAQQQERLRMRNVAIAMLLLICAFLVAGMWALTTDEGAAPQGFLDPNPYRFLSLLSVFMSALVWVLALMLMAHERLENRLLDMARTDTLTRVLNRAGFHTLAQQRLQGLRPRETATLLLLDLDHFKRINDTHGHEAGDTLLRLFAEATQRAIRPVDLLARHGGEEFCLLMPGLSLVQARPVAERIRRQCEQIRLGEGDAVFGTTVSIGMVGIDVPQETLRAALVRADTALYEAKHQGRNRVVEGITSVGVLAPGFAAERRG